MAGRPLRPATRRRLGRPSPHQQTDRPRAHPLPKNLSYTTIRSRRISGIRPSFPSLSRSKGQVTHVLLTRSPLIHPVQAPSFIVRLACVKHAASVRPEPGSNSPQKTRKKNPSTQKEKTRKIIKPNQSENQKNKIKLASQKQTNTLLS